MLPSVGEKTGDVPAAHQTRDVCKECNEGWLSRLEQAAQRLLVGFMEGTQKTLAPFDQLVIGLWAVKTSLMYDATHERRFIPEEQGTRRLFTLGYALPGSLVAIGHDPTIVPVGELLHARQSLIPPGDSRVTAVKFGFEFDHLILWTIINVLEDRSTHFELGSIRGHQVWPPGERFIWPSNEALVAPPTAPEVEPNEAP